MENIVADFSTGQGHAAVDLTNKEQRNADLETHDILTVANIQISNSSMATPVDSSEAPESMEVQQSSDEDQQVASTSSDCEDSEITFCPPIYLQRYGKVRDELEQRLSALEPGSSKAILEFGCAEFGMHFHLKHLPNVGKIIYVDIDKDLLETKLGNIRPLPYECLKRRETALTVDVYAGCATKVDARVLNSPQPLHAIIGIEILEHLNRDVEEQFVYTIFKKYAPPLIILTTPNGDFNSVFGLEKGQFRHWDHRFELTREEFFQWCTMVCANFPMYNFTIKGIGEGPPETQELGCVSQMAIFDLNPNYRPTPGANQKFVYRNDVFRIDRGAVSNTKTFPGDVEDQQPYELLLSLDYPWSPKPPLRTRIVTEVQYYISTVVLSYDSINRHYEDGGGDNVFLEVEHVFEVLNAQVPDLADASRETILSWLQEANFTLVESEGKSGFMLAVPVEEEESDDGNYPQSEPEEDPSPQPYIHEDDWD